MAKKKITRDFLKLRDPRESLNFGKLVAETDGNLAQYYVSPERFVERAIDIEDPSTFFVGPKGVGKSAILQMVRFRAKGLGHRLVDIRPDDLAFSALANVQATSPILGEATQHQWLFKTLWDYILTLEVLKQEYPDTSLLSSWFDTLFQGKYRKEARLLVTMSEGKDVSLTERILQLIKEVELSGEYAGGKGSLKVSVDSSKRTNTGEPLHFLSLVNSVAKKVRDQVSRKYYLLIDDLDLYWSNTPTQNAFIAALFTSLSQFSRPPSLKAIVALRQNIYDVLPLVDRDKFHDAVWPVKWNQESVKSIIERRVAFKLTVAEREVFGGVFQESAFDDIWKHSNGRPREAIRLTTLAAQTAKENSHSSVESEDLRTAIRTFSNERIREVSSEQDYKFPGLEQIIRKLSGWPKEFPYKKLEELVENLDFEVQCGEPRAEKYAWVSGFASNVKGFAQVLVECDMLWIKQSRTDVACPFDPQNPCEITNERWFAVHPMFAPALGLIGG